MGKTAFVTETMVSDLECLIKARCGILTRFCTCPMGRRGRPAVSHRSSSASRAFGSHGRSDECGYPRSPLRQDGKGVGSEARDRQPGFEGDIRCQTEQGMGGRAPAERRLGKVEVVPAGRVVEAPDVGEAPVPS